jgi:hypothetical protein
MWFISMLELCCLLFLRYFLVENLRGSILEIACSLLCFVIARHGNYCLTSCRRKRHRCKPSLKARVNYLLLRLSTPSYLLNSSLKRYQSIIAVHGLNGDSFRTWTEEKSKKLWLRDFLPQDLPRARIMTYGYNALPAFGNSVADIRDHARGLLESLVERREDGNVS